MKKNISRYVLSEAEVDGESVLSSDGGEDSVNEYDKTDGFIASEDESSESSASESSSPKSSQLCRPVLHQDILDDERDMEDALKCADNIRRRSKEEEQRKREASASTSASALSSALHDQTIGTSLPIVSSVSSASSSFLRPTKAKLTAVSEAAISCPPTAQQPIEQSKDPKDLSQSKERSKEQQSDQSSEQPPPSKKMKTSTIPIPPKPSTSSTKSANNTKAKKQNPYHFRVEFTDGASARRFLEVIACNVTEMRFHISADAELCGLRLEAHDTNWHTAIRSQIECSITPGVDVTTGNVLNLGDVHGYSFTVSAERFMKSLDCALLKDTTLSLTKYNTAREEITFEAISNEEDVRTSYACPLISDVDSKLSNMSNIAIELGFHVNINIDVLQKLTGIAKKCDAPTIHFEVHQAVDDDDPTLLHSRMRVGFEEFGGHDFYLSARKSDEEWIPMARPPNLEDGDKQYSLKSSNDYDAAKLRLFVSKLSTDWVLVHLSNISETRPLVIECNMGGDKTSHAIMIAPRVKE